MSTPDPAALPVARPREGGVDAAGVSDFLDAVAGAVDQELHSVVLVRHGRVCVQGWWAPYDPTDQTLLYSLSKSFTSTALGFAIAEGRVTLTDLVVDRLLPPGSDRRASVGPRTARMTLRDLAAMATGHHQDTLQDPRVSEADDPALGFLSIEPESDPGTVFAYNNPATYTLGAVLQAAVGTTLREYLAPRLFEPLGITPGWWDQRPPGRDLGFSGFHLTTDALARFGQLYLAGGIYAGRQVLPPGWAALATAAHTPNPDEPNPDWQQGYGFQFWRGRHGTVRADGAFGQFVVLLPDQDAVLVTTAGTDNMQGLLDAAWTHLLPAFDRPGSRSADDQLAEQLDDLHLVTERPDPGVGHLDERLEVSELTTDPDGWTLRLVEDDRRLTIEVGRDTWRRTDLAVRDGWGVQVAARGAVIATDPTGDVVIDVVLVETPHRLRIRTGSTGSTLTWPTTPLPGPTISGLATPRP